MQNPNAIRQISVYQVNLPFSGFGSRWVGRAKPEFYDSTLVTVTTESGLVGVGESCPLGAIYLPAFAGGLRAAIAEMAPALLGEDATRINHIYRVMDAALFGHGYAKAAIDVACWDLLGQHCAQPVSSLLGGRHQDAIPVYAPIALRSPAEMVENVKGRQAEGFTRFQIKLGDDPLEDVERLRAVTAIGRKNDLFMADANRGWTQADALRALDGLNEIDCYVEQPCATYEQCKPVRARCRRPFILDEVIDGVPELARAIAENMLDALVIKVTHAGGLTPARQLRDLCLAQGLHMRIEDTAGTEVARAAQAQLAAATPLAPQLGCYTFINQMPPIATGAPEIRDGMLHLNRQPGLGLELRYDELDPPLAVYE
ncbi:MAG: mandelate racemase/muconate lactonizing enzyme family protein [Gammaproteobacteria bacterium]|nr:mandelate racemase/muconate lactonizing enzyme family protein [Gammaproteobacteria bacterium]